MRVFNACYGWHAGWATGWLERRALPFDGGVAEQPAKLMEALEFIGQISNEEIREDLKARGERSRTDNHD